MKKQFFAKGKRGYIYLTEKKIDGKLRKIAVKEKNPRSEAIGNLENEARFLKILNRQGIGPRLVDSDSNSLSYFFVEGEMIEDFLNSASRTHIIRIIKDIAKQMIRLDKLGINKFEMNHPYKHIIIVNDIKNDIYPNGKPVLIDFERARLTEKPKNLTQFLQYISGTRLSSILVEKDLFYDKKTAIKLSLKYKGSHSNADEIFDYIENKLLRQKVWFYCKRVPEGMVSTYGEIARVIGNNGLSRAVGRALNQNPFAPKVPCHRIVSSDGSIGGFAGGVKKKISILKSEGITVRKNKVVNYHNNLYKFK